MRITNVFDSKVIYPDLHQPVHRVKEEAEKLAEWFDLSEREMNWVRTAKAGNEDDGVSEALLGIGEEGRFPLRVRASDFEADVIDRGGDRMREFLGERHIPQRV